MHDAPTTTYSNTFACPECGGRLEVYRTLARRTCVRRVRICKRCSTQFESVEQIVKRKVPITIALPVAHVLCTTIEHDNSSPNMTLSTPIEPRGEQVR